MLLSMQALIKITCVTLTNIGLVRSTTYFDLIANAFAVLVLAEYGNLASVYYFTYIESNHYALTQKEDFLNIYYDPVASKSCHHWCNIYLVVGLVV